MNVISWLGEADRKMFYLVNTKLSSSSLDSCMLLIRQPYTWIPLYFFLLLFFYMNCKRYVLPFIVLSVLTFALTDFTSASILKPLIGRLRPCHDATLQSISSVAACGGPFSMPSSHASNHFGLATFWFYVFKRTLNIRWNWLWVWATIVCFSQVYVGVHYPGDVIMGGLLGFITASLTYYFFSNWIMKIDAGITTAF